MKIIKKYTAIDPYYSDHKQVFIGADYESLDEQIFEYEKFLGRNHQMGISAIYKTDVLVSK